MGSNTLWQIRSMALSALVTRAEPPWLYYFASQ